MMGAHHDGFDDAASLEARRHRSNNGAARRIVIFKIDASGSARPLADPSPYPETLRCLANHDRR